MQKEKAPSPKASFHTRTLALEAPVTMLGFKEVPDTGQIVFKTELNGEAHQ